MGIFFTKYCFYDLQIKGFFMVNPFHTHLRVYVSFSWYLPDSFGLLLALSCQHFEYFVFFFSILALTIILKLFISIFVFSKRLLFFEGQSRKHFTFIVYALPSHITLSASQSSGAQEGIGKSKLSEERVEEW